MLYIKIIFVKDKHRYPITVFGYEKNKAVISVKTGIQQLEFFICTLSNIMSTYYVYILASKKNGTLYIGVTNNLARRVYEHRNDLIEGFTKKYNVHRLVFYEQFTDINNAIETEKRLKGWNRKWKIELIERTNPGWKDLYDEL